MAAGDFGDVSPHMLRDPALQVRMDHMILQDRALAIRFT